MSGSSKVLFSSLSAKEVTASSPSGDKVTSSSPYKTWEESGSKSKAMAVFHKYSRRPHFISRRFHQSVTPIHLYNIPIICPWQFFFVHSVLSAHFNSTKLAQMAASSCCLPCIFPNSKLQKPWLIGPSDLLPEEFFFRTRSILIALCILSEWASYLALLASMNIAFRIKADSSWQSKEYSNCSIHHGLKEAAAKQHSVLTKQGIL